MKRPLSFLILWLALALILAQCAPTPTPSPTPLPAAQPTVTIPAPAPTPTSAPAKKFVVYHVPKAAGIEYFKSAHQGMEEVAKEFGDVELHYEGPINATAEEQIKVLEDIITKRPDALIVSANDPQALVPVLKRAMEAGITVVTYDADVLPEARIFFINQATFEGVAKALIDEAAKQVGPEAKIAIISSYPTAPNQKRWIEEMQKYMAQVYPKMQLVDIRYGEEDQSKSRQQTLDLIAAHPEVQFIIAPVSTGLPGAADALEAAGKVGKVKLTGLSLPNVMRPYIKRGTLEAFYLWNVVDLGYLAMYVTHGLLTGEIKPTDKVVKAGRLGEREVGPDNVILLGPPFRFDKNNIDQFNF
ncbi:substrate-binding domain-containing protein [Thermoflexus sp.]|uniref:autoinducer 2 ABC transporter substrate-binding protein n=1 Tax=Thermoflexus sp. TaxID=1969742 RepID=UPI0035E426A2